MTHFIANVPAIDYLSLSTYNQTDFDKITTDFLSCDVQPEDTQRMQYLGQTQARDDGSIFWGTAEQRGMRHYLIQVSGSMADRVATAVLMLGDKLADISVTRIDLQLTIERPDWYKSRSYLDTLRGDVWSGRQRKVTLIDNYGNDTVYIGSRQSDRFARLYVKESKWLRMEFEYKKDRANSVWGAIVRHGKEKAAQGILFGELADLPKHPINSLLKGYLRGAERITPTLVKPVSARYKWFVKQCVPAIVTLLNDHDSGESTRAILLDLARGSFSSD